MKWSSLQEESHSGLIGDFCFGIDSGKIKESLRLRRYFDVDGLIQVMDIASQVFDFQFKIFNVGFLRCLIDVQEANAAIVHEGVHEDLHEIAVHFPLFHLRRLQ